LRLKFAYFPFFFFKNLTIFLQKKARFDLEKEAGVLHNSELSLQKTVEDLQLRLEESEKRLSILLEVQCEDDRV
jgi:hypothetical protein